MATERLEDIQKFETHQDKVRIYGDHLKERLQVENPQRELIRRMAPGYDLLNDYEKVVGTFYYIGEKVETPRKGLGKLLFGKLKNEFNALVKLTRGRGFGDKGSVIIHDASLRDSAEKVMIEQDEKSGEEYSSHVEYSTEKHLFKIK